jgi:hypothetical protein
MKGVMPVDCRMIFSDGTARQRRKIEKEREEIAIETV